MISHTRPFRGNRVAKRLLLITVATLAMFTKLHAQEFQFRPDRFYQRLQSSAIAASSQPPTIYSDSVPRTAHIWWTNDMPTNSTWYTKYKFKSISNVVRVGINHDLATITANYSYLISLKIRGFSNPASPTTATEKLVTIQVNYNKDSLQEYKDLTAYKVDGQFHAMDVIVTDIRDAATLQPVSRSQLAKNFYIEAEINAQRYVMQTQKLWVTREFNTAPQTNQLKVSWRHYDPGAQSFTCGYVPATDDYKPVKYELEWTYVDGYTINNYTSGSPVYKFNEAGFNIPYSFKNNSTTIQTYENNFTIPMVYEYGALIYRIRTIRPDSINYGKLVYSDWNLPDTGTLTNFIFNQSQPPYQCLNNCIYIIAQPLSSDSLNWQHSVSFAEEGKYKNVLQYFDGAGYGRQTITRINSDPGYIIAADKVYDYEGRPAIQTLPIPLQAQGLRYIPNLSLNKTTGLAYKASDFDHGCVGDSIAPLHENALGSRYYSPLNPDQLGMQKFVPDAKGYPFMQSVYSPDNTNKVIMQGGAGPDFQLWNHPTKTSYVRADQYELNRLMGTQAGKAQFYPKQVVTDPNGQSTFSIFNQNGQVVASALIGKAPDSAKMPIVALDNLTPMQTITTDLLASASQTVGSGLRLAEQSIFAEAGGINQLRYGVSVPPYNPSCGGKYINVKGFYKYNMVNDCGVVAASQTGTVGSSGVTTSAVAQAFSASPVSATLNAEKYTISKELYFPDTTMRRLASEFTDSSTGIGKCYVYEDSTIRRTVDAQTFPCAPGDTIGPCAQRRQQMKQELYPGAKYGGYLKNPDGSFAAGAPNSIFSAITFTSNSGLPPLPGPVQGGLYGEDACQRITSSSLPTYSQWYWSPGTNPSAWTLCSTEILAACSNGTDPLPPDGPGDYTSLGGPAVLPFPTGSMYYKTNIYVTDINVNNYTQLLILKRWQSIMSLFGVYVNGILQPNSAQNYPCTRYVTLNNFQLGWNEVKIQVGTTLGDPYCEYPRWSFKFLRGCEGCDNGGTLDSAYRYQSACLGNLPNITWQDPVSQTMTLGPAGGAPPQALIDKFNDSIAEALLPLHPEYCKLAFCNDDFDKKLAYIDNYQEAVALNMHNLPGIMAQDPLNQAINPNAPFTAYQLSHFDIDAALTGSNANLIRQLDTMSLEQAYCGCTSSEAYMYCKNQQYRQEINSLTLLNDAIKDLYFQKLRDNYLSNRNLRKQRAMDGSAGCAPCDSLRMTLVEPPVFPTLFTGSGNNIVDVPGAPDWMEGVIENGLNGNAFNNVPGPIQDSLNSAKLNQCKNQVRAIMAALVNCGMSATDSTNISNALINANCGVGSNGSGITPDIVKSVLTTNGIALSDLCTPFLVEYGLFDEQKRKDRGVYASRRQAFYSGLSSFLNRAEIKDALVTATTSGGTAYASLSLNSSGNEFEKALSTVLNNTATASVRAYTKTVTDGSFSFTYPMLVMQSGAYTDTLYFARRKLNNATPGCSNTTANPVTFQGATPASITFTDVASILDDPNTYAVEKGLLAGNLVYARLNGLAGSVAACDNYVIWSRNIPMLKERDPESLDYCINCEQIKNAVNDYYADVATYSLPQYTNHPLYADALSNYLNYKLKKNHTYEEYEKLMKGCSLSDKILFKKMRAGFFVIFSGSSMTAPNTFLTALRTTFPDINISTFIFTRLAPQVAINVDLNSIPKKRLRAVINYINAYSGPTKTYQQPPGYTTELFIKTGTCTPSIVIPNANVFSEVVQVPDATGALQSYGWYRITSTSTNPLITAQVLQATKDYVNSPSTTCGIIPFYDIELMRSSDYNDPVKQSYLNFAYGLTGQSQDDISDKLGPVWLKANAGISPITNATLVTYRDPWCSNVKEDLYYYTQPGTAHSGWTRLSQVLAQVKGQLSNTLFPILQTTTVNPGPLGSGGTSLKAFKMGEGGVWYRLFNQQNRLYNVYLYPSVKMAGAPESYQMSTAADALTIIPGADSIYRFKVKMQKVINGNAHVVDCYGYTDFSIGTGKKLKNVVLYDHQNQKGCTDTMNCERQLLVNTVAQGRLIHAAYIDSIKNSHFLAMKAHFPANSVDTLIFTTQKQQYQYTLYYYDRAGNLTRTVPPAGVDTLSPATIALVDASRNAGQLNYVPSHKKVSKYAYNALDQLIWQQTPDAGITEFFYDAAGRLAFSQNAKQKPQHQYSYTLYDDQGRISESGAITFGLTEYPSGSSHPNLVANSSTLQMPDIISPVRSKPRQDVVATFYDNPLLNLANEGLSAQENTRKRVSAIIHASFIALGDTVENYYDYASHFSYDALGNVSTLVQDNPYLQYMGQRFKRIDYDYDLFSGKVNMVSYNRGKADQFYQKYDYDADNRITKVQSSNDGLIWDRDAAYSYYKHGPLAQMQVGDLNVQSVQYAYTIQGWLKAINGDILRPEDDMGKNSLASDSLYPKDVYVHALDYHKGDYKPIGNTPATYTDITNPLTKSLYNGNIGRQTTGIAGLDNLQRNYQYDQLNRLKNADYMKVSNDVNHAVTAMANGFKNTYSYDQDGNIKSLLRKNEAGTDIDNLTYQYPDPYKNRLGHVTDAVAGSSSNDLPSGQVAQNYQYDAIGNLVKDNQGQIDTIYWDQYGKVSTMEMGNENLRIHYDYDGMGNRVRKDVFKVDNTDTIRLSDIYVRDASGNILAVYKDKAKITDQLTIEWVNNDIIDDHGGWTTPSGTGISPFLHHFYGTNGQFTVSLMNYGLEVAPTWSNNMSLSLSLNQFLRVSDGIYSQAVNTPAGEYFDPLVDANVGLVATTFEGGGHKGFEALLAALMDVPSDRDGRRIGTLDLLNNIEPGVPIALLNTYGINGASIPPPSRSSVLSNEINNRGVGDFINRYKGVVASFDMINFYREVARNKALVNNSWISSNLGLQTELQRSFNNYAPREEAAEFFGQWLVTQDPGWLVHHSSGQERLHIVYQQAPVDFLNAYGANVGIQGVNHALHDVPQLTVGSYVHDVLTAVLTGTLNPTYTPPDVNTPDPGNIKADTMYLAEHHVYGSNRLGIKTYNSQLYRNVYGPINGGTAGLTDSTLGKKEPWYSQGLSHWIKADKTSPYTGIVLNIHLDTLREVRTLGIKRYEMSDHLGNVLAVVMDRKSGYGSTNGLYNGFYANLASVSDYYPGGFGMKERTKAFEDFEFGHNGQMKTDEVYGKGNLNTAKYWEMDTRLRRRWNLDPVVKAWETPYATFGNNPILKIDILGDKDDKATKNNPDKNNTSVGFQGTRLSPAKAKKNMGEIRLEPQSTNMGVDYGGIGEMAAAKGDALESTLNKLANRTDYHLPGLDGIASSSLLLKGVGSVLEKYSLVATVKEGADFWVNYNTKKDRMAIPLVLDGGITSSAAMDQAQKMESAFFEVAVKQGYGELSRYFNNSNAYKMINLDFGFATEANAKSFISNGLNVKDAMNSGQLIHLNRCPATAPNLNERLDYMIIYNSANEKTTENFICVPVQ